MANDLPQCLDIITGLQQSSATLQASLGVLTSELEKAGTISESQKELLESALNGIDSCLAAAHCALSGSHYVAREGL